MVFDTSLVGITWAFTFAIILLSFIGKFGGCAIASRLTGYGWREASTIGALMSCKGLVANFSRVFIPAHFSDSLIELIVLNIGLQAGVLSQRVFSMFIVEALTLTCLTKPLVSVLYPLEYRNRADEMVLGDERGRPNEKVFEDKPWCHRVTVVLCQLDHIPSAMALTQLVIPSHNAPSNVTSTMTKTDTIGKLKAPEVSLDVLKLVDLSDRTSAIMKSSAADDLVHVDPVLGIFRMFGELNELAVTTSLLVIPYDDFARNVAEHAQRNGSNLILLPWLLPTTTANTSDLAAGGTGLTPRTPKADHNPFDILFHGARSKPSSDIHSQLVRDVFAQSKVDIALFIDTRDGPGSGIGGPMHVFLPFFGGPDDRLALTYVVQLCLNPRMTATVVRLTKRDGVASAGLERPTIAHLGENVNAGGLRVLIPTTQRGDGPTITSVRVVSCDPNSFGC